MYLFCVIKINFINISALLETHKKFLWRHSVRLSFIVGHGCRSINSLGYKIMYACVYVFSLLNKLAVSRLMETQFNGPAKAV